MLKNMPKILSPELLKVLCEMRHSDRIVLSDGNFLAGSTGKNDIIIMVACHSVRICCVDFFPVRYIC